MTTVAPNNTLIIKPNTAPEQDLKVANTKNSAGKFSLKCNDLDPIDYAIDAFAERNFVIPIGTTIFKNTGNVDLEVTTGA